MSTYFYTNVGLSRECVRYRGIYGRYRVASRGVTGELTYTPLDERFLNVCLEMRGTRKVVKMGALFRLHPTRATGAGRFGPRHALIRPRDIAPRVPIARGRRGETVPGHRCLPVEPPPLAVKGPRCSERPPTLVILRRSRMPQDQRPRWGEEGSSRDPPPDHPGGDDAMRSPSNRL
jgi:hypothetical protein